ncbi:Cytochrome c oxidase caa3 assembly factor (Caa3_CtaG) [Paenibacillus konkukensis]|uniref:Cytochrome c oxidase caa3 assembly factor (Caa3_CtaG) n=1 Tax=Paenibacillus konkukensis TaxID=2020716 RepID=A0ABY4RHG2_9BACL|nr:cytochrome c oxidase assembly protein [Paenibacillus konkukensis]UQZ81205.1 Cytochrome c oxidase caa3 assembly factor (Caa3_CtaG) [Paenibacillus konkukensis]
MDLLTIVKAYGFRAVFSPELLIGIAAVAYFYVKYRRGGNSRAETAYFLLGLFLFYLALGGPLNLFGHFWFSVHMLQQSILYLVAPPLIYRGMPAEWFEHILQNKVCKAVIAVIGNPLIAIFLFNGALSFYHIPFIFDATMSNYALHNMLHLLLLLTAFGLWWPVYNPAGLYSLSPLKKMAYIFINGIMLTPACALIIFAGDLLYTTYTGSTHLLCLPFYSVTVERLPLSLDWLTPLNDQQLGGVVMKIVQEVSYGCMLGYIFFQWYRQEKDGAEDGYDPLLQE